MGELLLENRKLEHRLCEHCDHTFWAQLHVPPLGANNAILRNRYLLAATDSMPALERSRASTQKCLADLDLEIEGLQKALQWALGARTEVKHLLDVQDAYFAPVRKLPTEILFEIFFLCCGQSTSLVGERCTPLDLSAVCKFWRDTMLSIPEIWTNFELYSDDQQSGPVNRDLLAPRLKAFLAHSRDLPLPQRIEYFADPESNLGRWNAVAFDIFLQYSHRWTSLRIVPGVARAEASPDFDVLRGRPLSCLTTLEGNVTDICEAGIGGLFMIPTLRCLKLTHKSSTDFAWPELPWMQIEELRTNSCARHAYSVLCRCQNVEVYSHKTTVEEPLSSDGLLNTVLPRLRHLSLDVACEASITLLGFLVTPVLEVLSLAYAPGFLLNDRRHVERLVARSSCRLRELHLSGAPEAEQECVLSLGDLTMLDIGSGISISSPHIRRTLLEELGVLDGHGAPRVLPRLQTLHLWALAPRHELLTSALEEMVLARRAMGFPLKANLVYFHPITHEIVDAEFT
ncbi:uncharacterized protein SCHCODRAFT_02706341 [Schizophyllum commune H4-8]|nr:uncharacterized protein SCHCODRAFT_02706341 [Schizophyllum commune H4-8]KAI5885923.1 hypothetical protein SCHCODRAFT_02706341 [Schizophyllum commune H4-8]